MPRRPSSHRNRLSPKAKLHNAQIANFLESVKVHRFSVDVSVRQLLDYVAPEDARQVRGCRRVGLRFHSPKENADTLGSARCKNPWCPWCSVEQHDERTAFYLARLASLCPYKKPKNRVVNLVWHVPVALRDVARHDSRFTGAWLKAIKRTIAGAYDYAGAHGKMPEKVCWSELGAICNYHAIGDKATPWPAWAPHMDMLLDGWVRHDGQMQALRRSWPEPYETTRNRYQAELRRALLPLYDRAPTRSIELQAFLASDFDVDWHVARAPEGGVVQVSRARHRVHYSCRPLFQMHRAKLRKDSTRRPVLV